MNLFDVENVSYAYAGRRTALEDISLSVQKGERVALLGPNGSGKSTLLRMLDGLIFPDTGIVRFLGKELTEETLRGEANRFFRRKVGLLFQNPDVQLFSPTVWEDILFGPVQMGFPRDKALEIAAECVSLFRIEELKDRSPNELSIGEKKRVAIASILAVGPDVLLLDEPTAGLDPRSCRDLIDVMHHATEDGKTIISATHDLHFVCEMADRVYVLGENKRILAQGGAEEILSDTPRLREWNLEHVHRHTHDGGRHEHEHDHILHAHRHEHEG